MTTSKDKTLRRKMAVVLPCVFTVGRLVCGFYAAVYCLAGTQNFDNAAKAIALAILFDVCDGATARMVGSASIFGRELDSLADVVTFGMAPALLFFTWGIKPILGTTDAYSASILNAAGWFVSCGFLVSGTFRLARFNLSDDELEGSHHWFRGLPIPGGAALIAAIIYVMKEPPRDLWFAVALLAVVAVLSILMVSQYRYLAFVPIPTQNHYRVLAFVFTGPIIWLMFVHFDYVFLVLAGVYAISGFIGHIFFRVAIKIR